MPIRHHRSSAPLLALAYVALVLYASLYPFEGWRWPPGQSLAALSVLPGSIYHDGFDYWSNLLGYMPVGALLAIVARRRGRGAGAALLLALAASSALSYSCEVLQQFLPTRVPTLEDLEMNAAGALGGALLAWAGHAVGLAERWHGLTSRWLAADAAYAPALLALWPLGLLFPAPVPLGLGQVGERLREWLLVVLDGVPWAQAAHGLLAASATPAEPLRPLAEALMVALGLLAPCLVAYTVVTPGWRRVALAGGTLTLGVAGMTLSTWLNFGPEHALAWLAPATASGLALGSLLAVLAAPLARRLAAGVGLVVLTGLVVGMAQAPADPYFAQNLQAWEQGQFVRFHGLSQWIGWLWPYAAMGWLLACLGSRWGASLQSDR